MRKLLRSFLTWLDSRFPEKVTVSLQDYEQLCFAQNKTKDALLECSKMFDKIEFRISNLEESNKAIKDAIVKNNLVAVKEKTRADFIAEGRLPI